MTSGRYIVRQRADGFAVWDAQERQVVDTLPTEDLADQEVARLTNAPEERTYGLKKFFAPSYRENWDPVSIEKYEVES